MEATEAQIALFNRCIEYRMFISPCCGVETLSHPDLTNPGEDTTQIYCGYGCGYIFLDDYIHDIDNKEDRYNREEEEESLTFNTHQL